MPFPEHHHASLGCRKTLRARLLFLETLVPALPRLTREPARIKALKNLEDRLLAEANRGALEETDGSLSDYVAAFGAKAKEAILPFGSDLAEAIGESAGGLSCQSCLNRTTRPAELAICEGGTVDDWVVHESGACVKEFRVLFEEALRTTVAWYEAFGTVCSTLKPTIEFGTIHDAEFEPFVPLPPFWLSGKTKFLGGEKDVAVVSLRFRTLRLHWSCFLSASYVLFHECMAHAFQDIEPQAERRQLPPPDDDPFLEGWMDYVALLILREHSAGRGPGDFRPEYPGLASGPSWRGDAEEQAEAYHGARADTRRLDRRYRHSGAVATGKAAAAAVLELLEEAFAGDYPTAVERLVGASCDLNVRSGLTWRRSQMADRVYDGASGEGLIGQWLKDRVGRLARGEDAMILLDW